MLKFKTEVPRCQGVELLQYKCSFNIPKHYTQKCFSAQKKRVRQTLMYVHKCLIFQHGGADRTVNDSYWL